jgi:hypothetical protein
VKQNGFPRRISGNGRYLADDLENPFFWLGDTAWAFFSKCKMEDSMRQIDDRAAKGFTVIQAVIAWADTGSDAKMPMFCPNADGCLPFVGNDPERPNEAYFTNVDILIRHAESQGITMGLLPNWGSFVTDTEFFSEEKAYAYGKWLGTRYRDDPNIVWINGGDILPGKTARVFDALALGLREGDDGRHLITFHPISLFSSSMFFSDRSWLDFHMQQTWTDWHKTYDSVLTDTLKLPRKPVILGEGAYEGGPEYPRGPITPLIVRRQAWLAFMAGGFFTYGFNESWRAPEDWVNYLQREGADQMGIFQSTLAKLRWWTLLSEPTLIEAGTGEGETRNAAMRSEDGEVGLAYLSCRCEVKLRLGRLEPMYLRATWINPATGEEKDAGMHQAYSLWNERNVRESRFGYFQTPDRWEDAVLRLEREAGK